MRLGLILLASWVSAQAVEGSWMAYSGSELIRHRYHRGYLPPLLMNGGFLGVSRGLARSGRSYQIRWWGEGRIALPVVGAGGMGRLKVVPGAATGFAFQAALPEFDQFYLQISPGVDAYWMQVGDPAYTTFSQDAQIRPILLLELGLPTQDGFPFFVRYGFYPTPGSTSRWILSIGSYFRI